MPYYFTGGLLPMNRDSTTGYFLAALRAAAFLEANKLFIEGKELIP